MLPKPHNMGRRRNSMPVYSETERRTRSLCPQTKTDHVNPANFRHSCVSMTKRLFAPGHVLCWIVESLNRTALNCSCLRPCVSVYYEPSLSHGHLSRINIERLISTRSVAFRERLQVFQFWSHTKSANESFIRTGHSFSPVDELDTSTERLMYLKSFCFHYGAKHELTQVVRRWWEHLWKEVVLPWMAQEPHVDRVLFGEGRRERNTGDLENAESRHALCHSLNACRASPKIPYFSQDCHTLCKQFQWDFPESLQLSWV